MRQIPLTPWNWQLEGWPDFAYDREALVRSEARFLRHGGEGVGVFKHLVGESGREFIADAATSEAVSTSAIEGETLNRASVRSSILRHLGAPSDGRSVAPREEGVARMMVDLLRSPIEELTHERLWNWHGMLMAGRRDLAVIGGYRVHQEPMRVVSGAVGHEVVHFEAPPSGRVPSEMERFLGWFSETKGSATPVARSGLAHLRFECVHPFEDGNGRIGRAIAELALAQGLGHPCLTMLSSEIEARQRDYYAHLERAGRSLDATDWLLWWAEMVLAAQQRVSALLEFVLFKVRLLDGLKDRLNPRQEKALLRVFREGPAGFTGGLSSKNYQTITGASPATAGRDLSELVALGAMIRTGVGKGSRYWLNRARDAP